MRAPLAAASPGAPPMRFPPDGFKPRKGGANPSGVSGKTSIGLAWNGENTAGKGPENAMAPSPGGVLSAPLTGRGNSAGNLPFFLVRSVGYGESHANCLVAWVSRQDSTEGVHVLPGEDREMSRSC